MTPIHVLCYNYTEIVSQEVDETIRCFCDEKSLQNAFLVPVCARLVERAKSLQGSVSCDPTLPCKISSQSVPICWSYFQKSYYVWIQYMPSADN